MLLREAAENDGRIDFLRYFGRLFRKILAPAAVVIIATTIAALFILPFTLHTQMLREAVASILYYVNLELITSEEHTSELQSRGHLVCRLLLETNNSNPRVCCTDGISFTLIYEVDHLPTYLPFSYLENTYTA